MQVDEKLIRHIAQLARLELTKEEIKQFLPQFKEILDAFSKLDEIKADEKPSFHPVELKNAIREDLVEESLTQDQALSLTEHKKDGYFKGPRVV